MRFQFTLEDLQRWLPEARLEGRYNGPPLHAIAALRDAGPGALSFLAHSRYLEEARATRASVVLVSPEQALELGENQALLRVDQPSRALAQVCAQLERQRWPAPQPGIHPSASVAPGARIADTAAVGAGCVIGADAVLAEGVVLDSGVQIGSGAQLGAETRCGAGVVVARDCVVGARCVLQPGCVIGSDGFGFEPTAGGHIKVPQIGIVVLEDAVEVGANTTIDRARFGETRIGEGSKLDNLVQIAHNVVIGPRTIICAQTGVSGSTRIGADCILAGQVGVTGHIELGDRCKVAAQAGVSKSWPGDSFITGSPATHFAEQRKLDAHLRRLPEYARRLRALERPEA